MTTLSTIDDDCLLTIAKFIRWKDFLSLASTCKSFRGLVQYRITRRCVNIGTDPTREIVGKFGDHILAARITTSDVDVPMFVSNFPRVSQLIFQPTKTTGPLCVPVSQRLSASDTASLANLQWLRHLVINDCTGLTPSEIIESCAALTSCLLFKGDMYEISLTEVYAKLRWLEFRMCRRLITVNVGVGSLPNMVRVNFGVCPILKDKAVIAIAKGCPNLQHAMFNGCKLLSDASVIAIAEHCPDLRCISFSGATRITDAGVVAISKCSKLQFAAFDYCKQLTAVSVRALAAIRCTTFKPCAKCELKDHRIRSKCSCTCGLHLSR